MTGYQHPECYARPLGDCSSQISREHYISEGILKLVDQGSGVQSETVDGTNLVFLKPNSKKKLTIGRLTSSILCTAHNSKLSPFDIEGLSLFTAIDQMNEHSLNPQLRPPGVRINGDRLERWMLKTLCGCLYSGNIRLPAGAQTKGLVPRLEFLDILFGHGTFAEPMGLHYNNKMSNELIDSDPMVFKYGPLMSTDDVVIGLQVWFFGFRFILLTEHLRPGVFTVFDNSSRRPAGMGLRGTNAYILFDWKDGPSSPALQFKSFGARPMS